MTEILQRMPDVRRRTGLSRSTIYRLIQEGRFPKPIKIGDRASAWPASVIDRWIAERVSDGGDK
ncbi:AlpA family transcriptional regulator [Thioalkalivibrio sp. AKL6]|uniref:helix-turn-helix transcriptional regulator n=1 Tax=Thioalkalivibrio sp. AKL6 TaxID=1158154 RepID=UPI000370EBB8|nr:AlpA family transcriptional regulator [Thioalkalivibrio sp. AKL6]